MDMILTQKRLSRIEARLNRVESHLRLERMPLDEREPDRVEPIVAANATTIAPPIVAALPVATIAQEPSVITPDAERAVASSPAMPPPLPKSAPTAFASPTAPFAYARPMPRPDSQGELERTIGLKWAGWIGAVALVIGAALGVKYVYDQGWLSNLIPPGMWLALITALGVALLAAGEWVYRKVNVISAGAVFGAGIATLFVGHYTGYSYYGIYSQSVAFILMGLTAALGCAVAMRGSLVTIGVLSIIGGNLAPVLLGKPGSPIEPLLGYLLALQLLAVVLAWWGKSGKWWTLRGLSLATTAFWMIYIVGNHHNEVLPLVFAIIFAAIYQLEVILSSLGRDLRREPAVTFSAIVTAGLTVAVLFCYSDAGEATRAAWVLGIGLLVGALGVLLSRSGKTSARAAALGFRAQAVGLLAVSIPIAFQGRSIDFGWLVLAGVLAVIARFTSSKISRIGAPIVWLMTILHIASGYQDSAVWMNIGPVELHTSAAMAMLAAIIGLFMALGLWNEKLDTDPLNRLADGVAIAATIVWVAASVFDLPPSVATIAAIGYAWLAALLGMVRPQLNLDKHSAALLLLAAGKWVVVDAFAAQLGLVSNDMIHDFLINPRLGAAILIAGSLAVLYLKARVRHTDLAAVVIMLIALSLEIDTWFSSGAGAAMFADPRLAEQVALSIFWALCAAGLVVMGFSLRRASMRYLGLSLFAITLLKVFLIDMSQVQAGYRVLSFMALGLLMMGTSVVYGKVSPKLLGQHDPAGAPPNPQLP